MKPDTPDTCPTCGSDDPKVRRRGRRKTAYGYYEKDCPDIFHLVCVVDGGSCSTDSCGKWESCPERVSAPACPTCGSTDPQVPRNLAWLAGIVRLCTDDFHQAHRPYCPTCKSDDRSVAHMADDGGPCPDPFHTPTTTPEQVDDTPRDPLMEEGYRECADLNREMAEENVAIAAEVLPEYDTPRDEVMAALDAAQTLYEFGWDESADKDKYDRHHGKGAWKATHEAALATLRAFIERSQP